MTGLSKPQLAILNVAKAKLNLTETDYRAAMVHLCGVTSAKDMDRAGFETMMGFFDWMGFKPAKAAGPDFGKRPGMASFAQLELIRVLWSEYTHGGADEDALNKWLLSYWKVSSLRFLTAGAAQKVITALKAMKQRRAH